MIEQALLEISEDMARLTAAMKAKGHHNANADFEVSRKLAMQINLRTGAIGHDGERAFVTRHDDRFPWAFINGTDYAVMLREAEIEIERMDKSIAVSCEAWFATEAA